MPCPTCSDCAYKGVGLPPLQVCVGCPNHIPHEPPVMSERITITVQ